MSLQPLKFSTIVNCRKAIAEPKEYIKIAENNYELEGISMGLRCQRGKDGCKYRGDLFEICPKYQRITENGELIFAIKNFPLHCKDCEDRDFDFCLRYKDLICFNEQDPFNCKVDLSSDELYGIELMKKLNEATKKAFLKCNLPYKEPHI